MSCKVMAGSGPFRTGPLQKGVIGKTKNDDLMKKMIEKMTKMQEEMKTLKQKNKELQQASKKANCGDKEAAGPEEEEDA